MGEVIEIALELVIHELLKAVVAQTKQTARLKTPLKRLEKTLKTIELVFYESWRLSKVVDRSEKETRVFIYYLEKGKKLVLKCSKIKIWNVYLHSNKLVRLNNEVLRFFPLELPKVMMSMSPSMRSLIGIYDLRDKMDQSLSPVSSISTDEAFCSNWNDPEAPNGEVLTLNVRSKNYSLPELIKTMGKLKVLNITSCSDYPSHLHNLSVLGSLSNLKEIRFEHVSVSSVQPIFQLRNLRKLSFVMCELDNALMSSTIESSYMLPNLTDLEFDQCYDLKVLPSGLCDLVNLKKLSITNCHELDVLPKGLGGLSNLEKLRLHCCTKLQELPKSIGSLHNLSLIDISDCLSISALPEEIGELCRLRVLIMSGCRGLQELPVSMSNLLQLEEVTCDEETSYLWMNLESDLYNLNINVVEDDRFESFMKIIHIHLASGATRSICISCLR